MTSRKKERLKRPKTLRRDWDWRMTRSSTDLRSLLLTRDGMALLWCFLRESLDSTVSETFLYIWEWSSVDWHTGDCRRSSVLDRCVSFVGSSENSMSTDHVWYSTSVFSPPVDWTTRTQSYISRVSVVSHVRIPNHHNVSTVRWAHLLMAPKEDWLIWDALS